jgi:hypothetical protein
MKPSVVAALVVLLAGLVIGLSLDTGWFRRAPDAAIASPPLKVDLMTLWLAYRDNLGAADARYSGRLVEVTGPVLTVDKHEGETWLFLFDLDLVNSREPRARCHFAAGAYPDLARLLKKAPVTVRGTVSWEANAPAGATIVLRDCALLRLVWEK